MSLPYNYTTEELKDLSLSFAALPIGAFEQHGSHLPMITDTLIAVALANSICQAMNGLLLSPITISCSQEHQGFFGSAFISAETLSRTVKEIVASLDYSGISLVVLVNAHGGNYVLRNVAQELNVERLRILLFPTTKHWQEALSYANIESTLHEDMHGGEIETSILLHTNPEYVRLEKIADHAVSERSLLHAQGMKAYTSSGIIGFPSLASAEKGQRLIECLTKVASNDLNSILKEQYS